MFRGRDPDGVPVWALRMGGFRDEEEGAGGKIGRLGRDMSVAWIHGCRWKEDDDDDDVYRSDQVTNLVIAFME